MPLGLASEEGGRGEPHKGRAPHSGEEVYLHGSEGSMLPDVWSFLGSWKSRFLIQSFHIFECWNFLERLKGFQGGSSGREPACHCRKRERHGFGLGWEDPCRRKWQPTPVFLPGEFHGQRSLAGCSPWDHKTEAAEHACRGAKNSGFDVFSYFQMLAIISHLKKQHGGYWKIRNSPCRSIHPQNGLSPRALAESRRV